MTVAIISYNNIGWADVEDTTFVLGKLYRINLKCEILLLSCGIKLA